MRAVKPTILVCHWGAASVRAAVQIAALSMPARGTLARKTAAIAGQAPGRGVCEN